MQKVAANKGSIEKAVVAVVGETSVTKIKQEVAKMVLSRSKMGTPKELRTKS